MGVISNFALDVEKILFRSGPVFVRLSGDSSADWYSLGVLADPRVSWNPVTTSKENSGREHMLCADFSISFKMLQTSYGVELANIDSLVKKFVDVKMCDGRASLAVESAESMVSVPGIIISGASLLASGELDFGGGESGIIVSFSFRITTDNIEEMHFGDSWVIDVDAAFDTPVLFAWQPEDDALTPYIGEGVGTFTRNSIATYVDADGVIQQVSANQARYQDGGILLEPQRTNLVPYSHMQGGQTAYGTPGTLTAGYGTFGSLTTTKLAFNAADAVKGWWQSVAFPGAAVAMSMWVRSLSGTQEIAFAVGGSLAITGRQSVGTAWTRITNITSPAAGSLAFGVFIDNGFTRTTGEFEIAGLMVEAGSYITSVIPTAGAAVTRYADALTLPFTAGLPAEGMTALWKGTILSTAEGLLFQVGAGGTGASQYRVALRDTGTPGFYAESGASQITASGGPVFASGTINDAITQIDVSNDTIRTFDDADAAQSTAAINSTAGHLPVGSVIGNNIGRGPFVLTALIIVRGLLTPAQMRRFLR